MNEYFCEKCGKGVKRWPSHVRGRVYCSKGCKHSAQAGDVYDGEKKRCNNCGEVKMFDNYYVDKRNRDGLRGICKECHNCANSERYYNDHESAKDKAREAARSWRIDNPERSRENRRRNYEENNERCKEWTRKYKQKLQKEKNPQHLLSQSLRKRLHTVVRRGYKRHRTIDLVGCSWVDLKCHIERQFQDGMCWDNHGVHGWHLDHMKPCNSFDLTDAEQQKECFHYTNLQPLWATDNLRKGAIHI